jgi:cytochrome c-type biogenesis protein CcmH
VRAVASELRCPVCQGESIQDSPAALAQEMKAIVREQLAAGRTPEEVKAYFVEKYGEWILLRPRARGWNMIVYVLPLLALFVGALVIARATRRWSGATDRQTVEEAEEETAET